jgi:hypothetical protein
MKASQKILNPSLVIWWVNTEGTQNFDMTAVKAWCEYRYTSEMD